MPKNRIKCCWGDLFFKKGAFLFCHLLERLNLLSESSYVKRATFHAFKVYTGAA